MASAALLGLDTYKQQKGTHPNSDNSSQKIACNSIAQTEREIMKQNKTQTHANKHIEGNTKAILS